MCQKEEPGGGKKGSRGEARRTLGEYNASRDGGRSSPPTRPRAPEEAPGQVVPPTAQQRLRHRRRTWMRGGVSRLRVPAEALRTAANRARNIFLYEVRIRFTTRRVSYFDTPISRRPLSDPRFPSPSPPPRLIGMPVNIAFSFLFSFSFTLDARDTDVGHRRIYTCAISPRDSEGSSRDIVIFRRSRDFIRLLRLSVGKR